MNRRLSSIRLLRLSWWHLSNLYVSIEYQKNKLKTYHPACYILWLVFPDLTPHLRLLFHDDSISLLQVPMHQALASC